MFFGVMIDDKKQKWEKIGDYKRGAPSLFDEMMNDKIGQVTLNRGEILFFLLTVIS